MARYLIVLQLYLAGYGVFGSYDFFAHLMVGDLIGIAYLLGIGLAFGARVTWRITRINGSLVVLMLIQAILAHTGMRIGPPGVSSTMARSQTPASVTIT